MAIILEGKRKFNFWYWAAVGLVLAVLLAGSYFLFFAPVPAIEVVAPVSTRSAAEISSVDFDPASLVNSDAFRSLRRYTGTPTTGQTGRPNPFIKY